MKDLGLDGITVSPGYAYERAPDQQHFLNRDKTKELFRDILRRGAGGKKWTFTQSTLFLDFLAGNQTYECTPWSMPARTVFGWQKPCYLLGEGYTKTFKELMETTDWDTYGVGKYEKCADCMVHCGFEGTAVKDTVRRPWKAAVVALRGVKTSGPMAPEIPLDKQRPPEFVFSRHVDTRLKKFAKPRCRSKPRSIERRSSIKAEIVTQRRPASLRLAKPDARPWPSALAAAIAAASSIASEVRPGYLLCRPDRMPTSAAGGSAVQPGRK